jgi:predicted MFS family arabinose efflux permease
MFGISVGGFWTIAVTLGSRLVPKPMMTRATTIIAAGISIATVLGVPAGTLIAGFAGWRMAFAAIGGVALLSGVAQLFVLPWLPPPPSPVSANSRTCYVTPMRGSVCSLLHS